MATISEKEFSTGISSQSRPYSDERTLDERVMPQDMTTLVEPTPQYPRPDDTVLAREQVNSQTFTNQTSYDPVRYSNVYGTLMSFATGTSLKVTYYRHIRSDVTVQTDFSDNDFYEDDIHTDLEQILNFELRVDSAFNFNWDDERHEAMFTGEAIVYPGFEPSVGDMFTYKIGDSIGLFKIDSFEPMSIRQGAYHHITFSLFTRLGEVERAILVRRTGSTVVFDLQKYMSGNLVLLQHESYINLEKLRELRSSIAMHYTKCFYDRNNHSYIRPDAIYDPYIVQYLLKKISSFDTKCYPMQLVSIYDYDQTVWSLFTDDKHTYLDDVYPTFTIKYKRDGVYTTQVNGLTNCKYLAITDLESEIKTPYVFSQNFYNKEVTMMSTMESLVYDYLTVGNIDPSKTVSLIQDFRRLDKATFFYNGAVYLHLIDIAIKSIT